MAHDCMSDGLLQPDTVHLQHTATDQTASRFRADYHPQFASMHLTFLGMLRVTATLGNACMHSNCAKTEIQKNTQKNLYI